MSWPMVALGEVAEIVGGATPKTSTAEYWDGEIAWATPKDLSGLNGKYLAETPRNLTEAGLKSCAAKLLPEYSVLFSSRAPIGHVAINTKPMATNQGFKSMIPGPKLSADFLYWWLRANRSAIERLGSGATFKEVSKAVVSRIEIPLPPLDEQKRIAAILDKADALRRARERVAELRLSALYGLFEAHFGSAPWSSYKKISLGKVTTKIGSGATPKGGNSSYQGDEIALIRSMNVHDCRFKDDGLAFIDDDQARKLRNVTVEADDVLLNITGASIARVCLVPETALPARVNQHVAIIRAAAPVRPSYLQSFLMHPPVKAKLLSIGEGGATRQAITKAQLEELEVPLPSLDQQLAFERAKHALLSVYALNNQSADSLHALFTSLQHRAFAGEL